jgi:leader peptidase (prepilin peptidase)/N-methyltransferase
MDGALSPRAFGALGYRDSGIVLEAGKKSSEKEIQLDAPTPFTWTRKGDDADFAVGEERVVERLFFARNRSSHFCVATKRSWTSSLRKTDLRFHYAESDRRRRNLLSTLDKYPASCGASDSREAMGRGDLKFLAAIGAFLGWRAVLFSVFAGSLFGSLVGLATLLVGRRVWSAKIPFGPYLAFGGLLWMFFGESLLSWYMRLLNP